MEEIAEKIFRLCLKNKVQFMTRDICQAAIKHIFQEEGECSIEYLDSGGFGLVLKYYNPNKLKKGAVKIIVGCAFSEEAMKETKKEIDLQININNPYIAKLKGFTKIVLDKTYLIGFIWMHYYEDGSLKSYLDRLREKNQEMDFKTKMRLGIELFDALSSMHQQNIFHRDIKAANILMNQDDCAIADFGVSKIQNIDQQISQTIKGTPMFWDPEIHTGKSDKKMDLFAMGIVLLMMDNVVKFCYESHVLANMMENYGYYQNSFAKYQIIQELREKLNTTTIFFKIAEKLITTKPRSRLSAAQCLDILKEEEQKLNLFPTSVYSTKKYGQSRVVQNEDESVIDDYGDEGAQTNSVKNQSVKSFSSVSSLFSNKNENSVFIKGQKNYQQIDSNDSSNSNRNNNNIQKIQQQYTTNNFIAQNAGKTFNNQVNDFMVGLVTNIQPIDSNKKSPQIGGFSDHVNQLENQFLQDPYSQRSLQNDDNVSSEQSSNFSSIGVQQVAAFQKFYIKPEQIFFYEGLFEDFQQKIIAKKTDYNRLNGVSFKLKPSDNLYQIQEHLIARKVEQLLIHIKSYFDHIKQPIYYFELDLKYIQNINDDSIELIYNFLSSEIMKKIKFLYLKLKGEQKSEGFKKLVKALSDLYEIEKLDLQLLSFTNIKDSHIQTFTKACLNMENLYSLKLNLQDNSTLRDSSLEYLGNTFLKLQQLEEIQLIFWNNTKFSDYGLQQLCFGKKLAHFDFRFGNCSNVSDAGIGSLCENLTKLEKFESFKLFSTITTQFTDSALRLISSKLKRIKTLKVFNLQFNLAENISDEGLRYISELFKNPDKNLNDTNEFSEIVINFNSSKCFSDKGISPLINSLSAQKKLTKLKLSFNECEYLEGSHLISLSNSLEQMKQLTYFQLDFNQSKITFGFDFLFRAFSTTKMLKKLKIFLNKSILTADSQNLFIQSISQLQLESLVLQLINNDRVQYQQLKSCEAIKSIKEVRI